MPFHHNTVRSGTPSLPIGRLPPGRSEQELQCDEYVGHGPILSSMPSSTSNRGSSAQRWINRKAMSETRIAYP